jgi:hypothetical protein
MTINMFLGLNEFNTDKTGKRWTQSKKYTAMVKALGFDNIRALLPFTKTELEESLKQDKQLGEDCLPRPFSWDAAAGFKCYTSGGANKCTFISSPLTELFKAHNIRGYTVDDGIAILKQCAHMLVRRKKDNFPPNISAIKVKRRAMSI